MASSSLVITYPIFSLPARLEATRSPTLTRKGSMLPWTPSSELATATLRPLVLP